MTVEADLAQALQHFVSQSPWDARRLLATLRLQTRTLRHDPDALLVVHEGVFPKKGKHSVGVQRQFARSVGRKINCQIAIFISQIGPRGFFPLAARLYLPSHWLRENPELAERMIPEDERHPATKTEIALGLLDELQAEQEVLTTVTAEPGYIATPDFIDGIATRRLSVVDDYRYGGADAQKWLEWLNTHLGLDHFEGRTWHGWHHHISLVFATYSFLFSEGCTEIEVV
jgi:SRSO17 transposase